MSMVKIVAREDGTVILSLGQKSLGVRFAEAERLSVSPGPFGGVGRVSGRAPIPTDGFDGGRTIRGLT